MPRVPSARAGTGPRRRRCLRPLPRSRPTTHHPTACRPTPRYEQQKIYYIQPPDEPAAGDAPPPAEGKKDGDDGPKGEERLIGEDDIDIDDGAVLMSGDEKTLADERVRASKGGVRVG